MPETHGRRLRILTWHIHGNYLYYLSQVPHDFYIVTRPDAAPGYAPLGSGLPWGDNIHEISADRLRDLRLDCVLYQSRQAYLEDRINMLSATQRRLPQLYLEHDPPQQHPTNTVHWFQEPAGTLVHVTAFNALMWDNGCTPTAIVEHGVRLPPNVAYQGTTPRGIVVVNHLARRGRRLGADVFAQLRASVPLDLVGMDAQAAGGIGEILNLELPAFMARYRFFFNPIRYTSLGLAVIEAMMAGVPVVGLATTEMATVIENGANGYVDTRLDVLADVMQELLADPDLARAWGREARLRAMQRFGIERFVRDWMAVFAAAAGSGALAREPLQERS
ncbi:D-inositol-3-phosphate glycosyltransferase [Pigmentiphaga humi]|uniref:D-inositol-3-phosphate glycosyltransferase n=1 Tax=Pigmentiphaga humi TaxID=2478468 RepID=A0A3P4B1N5_9BURK|nr:glycosyltransferase family 4 protein [Pigmentiphaga humi]VCU69972.1 D-inositol-3-phosphate glycosyltransferase [Pigmentiphaga humi]